MLKILLVLLGALLIVSPSDATRETQDTRQSVQAFLSEQFRLKPAEFSAITQRKAIARTLEAMDGREVATLGVIEIGSPPTSYVDQLRNIVEFERHEAVLQIGTFSTPARMEDVASLTLERGDVEALRGCRPRDCDVQLSGARRSTAFGTESTGGSPMRQNRRTVSCVNSWRNWPTPTENTAMQG
jgi:hypothetical protein